MAGLGLNIGSSAESLEGLLRTVRGRRPEDVLNDPELKILAVKAASGDQGAFQEYVSRVVRFTGDPASALALAKAIIDPMRERARLSGFSGMAEDLQQQATGGIDLTPEKREGLITRSEILRNLGLGGSTQETEAAFGKIPVSPTALQQQKTKQSAATTALSGEKLLGESGRRDLRAEKVNALKRIGQTAGQPKPLKQTEVTTTPQTKGAFSNMLVFRAVEDYFKRNEELLSKKGDKEVIELFNKEFKKSGKFLNPDAKIRKDPVGVFGFDIPKTGGGFDVESIILQLQDAPKVTTTVSGEQRQFLGDPPSGGVDPEDLRNIIDKAVNEAMEKAFLLLGGE